MPIVSGLGADVMAVDVGLSFRRRRFNDMNTLRRCTCRQSLALCHCGARSGPMSTFSSLTYRRVFDYCMLIGVLPDVGQMGADGAVARPGAAPETHTATIVVLRNEPGSPLLHGASGLSGGLLTAT